MDDFVIEEMNRRPVDLGSPFGKIDWHHAILTKYDVMGLPKCEKEKIDSQYNMLKLGHDFHINGKPPIHQEAALLLYKIYGKAKVQEWFNSIEWKSSPPFILPEGDDND